MPELKRPKRPRTSGDTMFKGQILRNLRLVKVNRTIPLDGCAQQMRNLTFTLKKKLQRKQGGAQLRERSPGRTRRRQRARRSEIRV